MTATLSRTKSAAMSATRSMRPSAQRYSIATVRPSIQPSSRSRCTKAVAHGCPAEAEPEPRKPMVGNFPAGCCALAASGHAAAAPPSTVMNSRRRMLYPEMLHWPKPGRYQELQAAVLNKFWIVLIAFEHARARNSCPAGDGRLRHISINSKKMNCLYGRQPREPGHAVIR